MEDIKTISCPPEHETEVIRTYESFGYYLHSSNEIYNKDTNSSLERDFFTDNVYQKTTETVTHYVKMVFRRNPSIANYNELRRLEAEFDNCQDPGDEPTGWGLIAILIGLCFWFVPGILMIVWNCTKVKERKQEYWQSVDAYIKKRESIVESARKLLV